MLAVILEDDANLLTIFSEAVRRAGYDVACFQTGEAAYDFLNTDPPPDPTLILLDLHLPGISGVDVLHRIRRDGHFERTKIILATADPVLASVYREQVDLVLLKPISYHQLRDLAHRLTA